MLTDGVGLSSLQGNLSCPSQKKIIVIHNLQYVQKVKCRN